MPKASADYRAVRAVLSAPYPLPVVITRNGPPVSPIHVPPPEHQSSTSVPQPDESYHGFPIYNSRWRELPPAILPVPYPDEEKPKGRNRTLKLKRMDKREGESSEIDLMSIDGPPSKELQITRRLSEVKLGRGQSSVDTEQPEFNNILNAVYEANIPLSFLPRPDVFASVDQATTSPRDRPGCSPVGLKGFPTARLKAEPSRLTSSPLRPCSSSSSSGSDPVSDMDADEEDMVKKWSSPSQQIQTPSTRPGSNRRRHPIKNTKNTKALFIGQTDLTPFTYQTPNRSRKDTAGDGFASEASSIGIITRIPRNRHSKLRRNISASRAFLGRSPVVAPNKGKERAVVQRTPTPLQRQNYLPHETVASPRLQSTSAKPAQTPYSYPSYHGQHDPQPAEIYPAYPLSILQPSPEAVSHPNQWAVTPTGYPYNDIYGYGHPSYLHGQPYERPWTPKPMSVDPRSADPRLSSWPHPLNAWETGHHVPPTHNPALMPILEESTTSPSISNSRNVHPPSSPVPGLARGLHLPSAPPTRPPVILPMAKACHNFLLARRVQASNRRKQFRELSKRKTAEANRPTSPMNVDCHDPISSPAQQAGSSNMIRPVLSIAHVDESKPARKRHREISVDSPRLLPPAEIVQPEYHDTEADFTAMLRGAVHGQTEVQEADSRREAWLEQERRRVAGALHGRGSPNSYRERRGLH